MRSEMKNAETLIAEAIEHYNVCRGHEDALRDLRWKSKNPHDYHQVEKENPYPNGGYKKFWDLEKKAVDAAIEEIGQAHGPIAKALADRVFRYVDMDQFGPCAGLNEAKNLLALVAKKAAEQTA